MPHNNQTDNTSNNRWYQSVWLPFAAATYIVICIFDFMVMPIYVAAHNSKVEAIVFASLEGKDVATFATTIAQTAQATKQWNPLTLLGAGMFHLAFGALLTGGAVTRGFAKKSEIEGYYRYGTGGYGQEDYYSGRNDDHDYAYNRGSKMPPRQRRPDYGSQGPTPKAPDVDD